MLVIISRVLVQLHDLDQARVFLPEQCLFPVHVGDLVARPRELKAKLVVAND